MIPEDQDRLESLLRRQALRRPPDELDRRLAGVWLAKARARRWLAAAAALAASLAVAAAWMLMFAYRTAREEALSEPGKPAARAEARPALAGPGTEPAPPRASAPSEPPIRIERVWSTPVASQVVMMDDAAPALQERRQVTRELRWIDEQAGVTVEWTISDEQTAVVGWEYQ